MNDAFCLRTRNRRRRRRICLSFVCLRFVHRRELRGQAELLRLINTSGLRLLNIVNDLLDAAKISRNGSANFVIKEMPVRSTPSDPPPVPASVLYATWQASEPPDSNESAGYGLGPLPPEPSGALRSPPEPSGPETLAPPGLC